MGRIPAKESDWQMSGNPRWIYDGTRGEGKWVLNLHKSLTKTRRAGLSPEITHQAPTPKKAASAAAGGGFSGRGYAPCALSEDAVGVGGCAHSTQLPDYGLDLNVGAVGDSTKVDRRHRTITYPAPLVVRSQPNRS